MRADTTTTMHQSEKLSSLRPHWRHQSEKLSSLRPHWRPPEKMLERWLSKPASPESLAEKEQLSDTVRRWKKTVREGNIKKLATEKKRLSDKVGKCEKAVKDRTESMVDIRRFYNQQGIDLFKNALTIEKKAEKKAKKELERVETLLVEEQKALNALQGSGASRM